MSRIALSAHVRTSVAGNTVTVNFYAAETRPTYQNIAESNIRVLELVSVFHDCRVSEVSAESVTVTVRPECIGGMLELRFVPLVQWIIAASHVSNALYTGEKLQEIIDGIWYDTESHEFTYPKVSAAYCYDESGEIAIESQGNNDYVNVSLGNVPYREDGTPILSPYSEP